MSDTACSRRAAREAKRGSSMSSGRPIALARRGRPYDKPHLMADLPEVRDRYIEALKLQQLDHMERSLTYCRKTLDLGVRWRGQGA